MTALANPQTGSSFSPEIYAIDFGTTNSLLGAANRGAVHPPIPLDPHNSDPTILRSILYFPDKNDAHVGAAALSEYIEQGMEGRLLRSLKRFLPRRQFTSTTINGQRWTLQSLVGLFLRQMRERANRYFNADVTRVVLGRPAKFSPNAEDDALAEERLREGALLAGFTDISFCPEPVAAARDFRHQLVDTKLVLVADFGGGTSDFSVVRMRPEGYKQSDVLSVGGVFVAGDALDGTMMRTRIARHFGASVTYQVPFGKNRLTMPIPLMEKLCSPADTSLLGQRDILSFIKDIKNWSLGPDDKDYIDQLLCLVEDALGFQVFESIEQAKRALSTETNVEFCFDTPGITIRESITRAQFEKGCEKELGLIVGSLDQTLNDAQVSADQIDIICSTGGTARVPCVADALTERFDSKRFVNLSSFHAVTEGLTERAQALLTA